MIAVLTGDIVSSQSLESANQWSKRLKQVVEKRSGLAKIPRWDVFRGDGFQVELEDPSGAIRMAILIRAGLKSIQPEDVDARIGIGIGKKGYTGKSVNESNGEAYLFSGAVLDSLKNRSHRLEINTPWPVIDKINIALRLASVIIDDWTSAEAEIAFLKLSEDKTQEELAKKLDISQPAVHKRLSKAHYQELQDLILFFETELNEVLKNHSKK
jgi:hypothetical protein